MAENTINVRLLHAYKSESEWNSSNPILKLGEAGYVSDANAPNYGRYKIGDGVTAWKSLPWGDKGIWDAVNGMEIGGRNLIPNSKNANLQIKESTINVVINDDSCKIMPKSPTSSNGWGAVYSNLSLEKNQTYTFSAEISDINIESSDGYALITVAKNPPNSAWNDYGVIRATKIGKYYITFNTGDNINVRICIGITRLSLNDYVVFKNLKLEKGNKPTDWSPAPEDKADVSHTHSASDITSGTFSTSLLPTIPVSKGGTGLTSLTSGQVLIGNGTNNITTRAIDTTTGGTSGSTSLITSGAVYAGLAKKADTHIHPYLKLDGSTQMTGDLKFTGVPKLWWNDGTYQQRIAVTDDSTSDTAVFSFQQSSNSGSSFTDLMVIKDNGKVVANTFVGALSGAASQVYSTLTNPSTGTAYYIPFHSGASSANKSLLNNNGIVYWTREGTTSVVGVGELGLGNNIVSGTAGNKYGILFLYGKSSGYTDIIPGNNSASNITITLPSATGILARTVDNVASASKWQTSRTLTIGNTGKSVDGTANVSWSIAEIGAVNKAGDTMSGSLVINPGSANSYNEGVRANLASNNWATFTLGGASGSSSGTGDGIWNISRNPSGNLVISHNGSGDNNGLFLSKSNSTIKFKGNTILHSGNYSSYALPLSGGTMTGQIQKAGVSSSWIDGRSNAMIRMNSISGYSPFASIKTTNGSWEIGSYNYSSYTDDLVFSYCTDANFNSGNNSTTAQIKFLENGHIVGALDGNASTVSKVLDSYNGNEISITYSKAGQSSTSWLASWNGYELGAISPANITSGKATQLATSRNIFGKSFNGTADVAGQGLFYGTYTSTASSRYSMSGLQIRENGLVTNNQSDIGYAPTIGFHWSGRIGATLAFNSDGIFYFRKQDGTSRATIDANVNGNATSSTNATNATNVTQTAVTASGYTNWRTLIWGASNSGTEGFTPSTVTGALYSTNTISCQPSTGTIRATTFKGALSGNASTATRANTVLGSYTNNGGQQNPNYFGMNKVGFLMMNTTVNGNSQYKDWIIMDCYSGSDVGGGVALGVNRQSLGAYIMRSSAERTSWAEKAELLHTSNWSTTVNRTSLGAMAAISANGYYGMGRPDGNTWDWIRTTSSGIIPYQSGGAGSGHCSLGTSSWYFSSAYIDNVYGTFNGNLNGTSAKANNLNILHGNEINFTNGTPSGIWFNYRNGDSGASSGNTAITTYSFGNRNGSTSGVTLVADSFSGNAASATASNSLIFSGTGNHNLTAYQTDSSYMDSASGWASYIICNHGDGSTYYNQTIRMPFWGIPQYSRLENGTRKGWFNFITDENISSQSVNYASSAGNADKLDGYHGSTSATASTYVLRDSNNYIFTNYINSNTANNENPSVSQVIVTNGNDNYYRKASISHLADKVSEQNKVWPIREWWTSGSGQNVNDIINGSYFVYTNHNAPTIGILASFACRTNQNYRLQIVGQYSGNNLYFRNKNGDNNTWMSWNTVITNNNYSSYALPLSGGTVTGTLTLSKTTDLSGTADNGPALIVGGTRTTAHMEIDANEITAKTDGTTPTTLVLNNDGGNVKIGGPLVLKTTSYGTSLPSTGVTGQIFFKVI